jgi:ATP-binding cassette, subfamily B, bacterial
MRFHHARTPGELIERIDEDVTALANFFSQFVITVVGNVLLIGGVLLLLFIEHWSVGAVVTLSVSLSAYVLYLIQKKAQPHWIDARQTSADLSGYIEERLVGLEDIRANGATLYKMRLLYHHMRNMFNRYRAARVVGSLGPLGSMLFYNLALVAVLALGAHW